MELKRLLFSFTFGFTTLTAVADTTYDGIFLTYDGADICYKLSEVPKFVFDKNDNTIKLFLSGTNTPIKVFSLTEEWAQNIKVVFGIYDDTKTRVESLHAQKTVKIIESAGVKYISGGRLIIIGKDGKIYNQSGQTEK